MKHFEEYHATKFYGNDKITFKKRHKNVCIRALGGINYFMNQSERPECLVETDLQSKL